MAGVLVQPPVEPREDHWQLFQVREIEDLRNLVLGARLDTLQMAGRRIGGSLAFSAANGVIFSSGLIEGNAWVRGVLSEDAVTIGLGLSCGKGSRVCLHPAWNGCVGVVRPGDEVDMLFAPGTLYVAATVAAGHRLVGRFSRGGFHRRPLGGQSIEAISSAMLRLHGGEASIPGFNIGRSILSEMLAHCERDDGFPAFIEHAPHERVILSARDYVGEHLVEPIRVRDLAAACDVSVRTVYRSFLEVLGETPNSYVRRLRLHRIRRDLLSDQRTTIVASSNRWGIGEHGRMSGWYRDVFGEQPSATLVARHRRELSQTWL
ncbi:helix-turn-helix domain-containing protein [Rhizobium sp. WYJ-E13]|uniref:helix-turn-helix domain-containing protein n=1 Tax=Rhizobium sp. WYJ-E13 TaxID=2849093 RepID=UPI001C1ED13A|nr:helix-turn-helix domain-containing protein [Rhizobium sp. WYJ-E13]QWW70045.1 helix-turn-helix domain-containing protein [Rhizobium sp. WYJ-E13]